MKRWFCIGLVILCIFLTGCIGNPVIVREPLASLDRENTIHGSFVLGSGTIDGQPSYSYYVQTSDGGYKLVSVNANSCIVYKDEDNNPYVIAGYRFEGNYMHDSVFGHAGDEVISQRDSNGAITRYLLDTEVELHIPRNSTIGGYNP